MTKEKEMNAQIKHSIETITPAMAEKWLENNPKNRSLRERRVNNLVRVIKKGQWQFNGDAIRIANDGSLIDGQHRLAAIMESKTPCESLVIRGLSPDVMTTIDLGASRSMGDHLKIHGYKGCIYALAAAVTVCLQFKEDGSYTEMKEKFSPDDALEFLRTNKGILKSTEFLANKKDFQDLLPRSVSISTHYLFKKIHHEDAEKFFHYLITGEKLCGKSPILKLRSELILLRMDSKKRGFNRKRFLHLMTTAFQAYLDEKKVDGLPSYKADTKVSLPKVRK